MTEPMYARHLRRVAPLALVVVVAAACGDNNKSTAAPKTPTGTTTASVATKPALTVPTGGGTNGGRTGGTGGTGTGRTGRGRPATGRTGTGTLVIGKRNLFPLLKGSIRRFAPTQVEGHGLHVVALAGPTSFWAGRSAKQRILVTMRLKGGSPPKITVGQKADFIGLLTAAAANAGSLGVRNGADTTLLEKLGAYVDASAADVKLR